MEVILTASGIPAGGPPIVVEVSTSDGSATNSDYAQTVQNITFNSDGVQVLSINITDDAMIEPEETFSVSITYVSFGATIDSQDATVTIIDNDGKLFV